MQALDMAGHLIRRLHQLSTQVFVQRTQAAGFDLILANRLAVNIPRRLADAGVDTLELSTGDDLASAILRFADLRRLAHRFDLFTTRGSDAHEPQKLKDFATRRFD